MVVDIGILVLHMLVCLSVGSDFAKLFSSNSDQHRGEGGATGKHGIPTGYKNLLLAKMVQ